MTALLVAVNAVTLVALGITVWWYRRKVREAESAVAINRKLRRVAEDTARIAQAVAEHQARVANALYVRLREEDRREIDEIVGSGDVARAADFLRSAFARVSGGAEGGGVPSASVPAGTDPADQ